MLENYGDILTIDELCEVLMIGYNGAYDLLNEGQIQAFRIGRNWKIPKEAVVAFIRERARKH